MVQSQSFSTSCKHSMPVPIQIQSCSSGLFCPLLMTFTFTGFVTRGIHESGLLISSSDDPPPPAESTSSKIKAQSPLDLPFSPFLKKARRKAHGSELD